jgi:hypothetical protein
VGEISQSAENDQAAWAGRGSHICWDLFIMSQPQASA